MLLFSDMIIFTVMRESHFVVKCPGRTLNKQAKYPVLFLKDTHIREELTQSKGILLIDKVRTAVWALASLKSLEQLHSCE